MHAARARRPGADYGTPRADGRADDGTLKSVSPVRGTSGPVLDIIATLRRMQPLVVEVFYRALNLIVALFFWLAAYVQINDDDSEIWMVLYAIPATVATLLLIRPSPQVWRVCRWLVTGDLVLALVVLVYTTWVLSSKQHDSINILVHEEGREFGGLLLVILYCISVRFLLGSDETWKSGKGEAAGPSTNRKLILLMSVGLVGSCVPLFLWSLCYVADPASFAHCSGFLAPEGHCQGAFGGGGKPAKAVEPTESVQTY